ncbi:peptidylprolyl isomerase [Chitinimonas sp. BJYL2]|uniref:FKBP-type peptidyl-prolyl cis-trans isomerase n=1 Tax=Chitinimonas sp. BJYL2 TaxID=2976696 RepID=UPI0022B57A8B|nr:peptidylprolyl isomerase [Chitinimonas sp. BJYL2]
MEIAKNAVVALQYEMYDAENQLLDKTEADEPMVYLHGGYDGIFPVVEEALQGKKSGDKIDVTMEPDDAFGEYDADLVRIEPQDIFPKEIEVGMTLEADDPESGDVMLFTITDIADGKVVVDGNHPLAGKRLRFVATVGEVRAASKEEIAHGHVHGAHGHHH